MKSKAGTKAELRAACCPWAAEAAAWGLCSDSFSALKIYVLTLWFSAGEGGWLPAHPASGGCLGLAPHVPLHQPGAGCDASSPLSAASAPARW